jgi:hypothetical protein
VEPNLAIDYVKLAATAQRLIEANGRTVTITLEASSQAVIDPTKPWRGNSRTALPADGGPVVLTPNAVISKYTDKNAPFDTVKRGKKFALIAQNSVLDIDNNPIDLRPFSLLLDSFDNTLYQITEVDTVAPGPIVIMYRFDLAE